MFTELQRTFIEEAAREIRHAGTARRCGGCGYDGNIEIATHTGWFAEIHQAKADHPFTPRQIGEDPVQREDEHTASYLLGRLEERNGPIECVVKAALRRGADDMERTVNLFRAIVRECLGLGKVSEEFGEIGLPVVGVRGCAPCQGPLDCNSHATQRPFSVPRFALTTEGATA